MGETNNRFDIMKELNDDQKFGNLHSLKDLVIDALIEAKIELSDLPALYHLDPNNKKYDIGPRRWLVWIFSMIKNEESRQRLKEYIIDPVKAKMPREEEPFTLEKLKKFYGDAVIEGEKRFEVLREIKKYEDEHFKHHPDFDVFAIDNLDTHGYDFYPVPIEDVIKQEILMDEDLEESLNSFYTIRQVDKGSYDKYFGDDEIQLFGQGEPANIAFSPFITVWPAEYKAEGFHLDVEPNGIHYQDAEGRKYYYHPRLGKFYEENTFQDGREPNAHLENDTIYKNRSFRDAMRQAFKYFNENYDTFRLYNSYEEKALKDHFEKYKDYLLDKKMLPEYDWLIKKLR